MFVQMRRTVVTEGNAEQIVSRFSKEGIVEKQDGFIDMTVMVKKVPRGDEEVVILTRWESEEHWKQWEKSDAHIAGHKARMGQPKPDEFIHVHNEDLRYCVERNRQDQSHRPDQRSDDQQQENDGQRVDVQPLPQNLRRDEIPFNLLGDDRYDERLQRHPRGLGQPDQDGGCAGQERSQIRDDIRQHRDESKQDGIFQADNLKADEQHDADADGDGRLAADVQADRAVHLREQLAAVGAPRVREKPDEAAGHLMSVLQEIIENEGDDEGDDE